MKSRRGFTLTELVFSMLIAGVIGVALTKLVINQARFVGMQDGMMRARGGARAALNMMTSELRMVSDGALTQANRDSITVRVPYAYGVACGQVSGTTVMGLLPADSAYYGAAAITGYAWRDSLGKYQYVQPATATSIGTSTCSSATPGVQVLSVPGWSAAAVALSPNVLATPVGAPMYLYQTVRYSFAPSGQLPGRRGLWRATSGAARDEIVTPFDTSAHFEFLVGSNLTVQTTAPVDLNTVKGLKLRLVAASEDPPEGRLVPVTFDITTNLLFRNNAQ